MTKPSTGCKLPAQWQPYVEQLESKLEAAEQKLNEIGKHTKDCDVGCCRTTQAIIQRCEDAISALDTPQESE